MKELIKNHHLRKNIVLFLLALGVIATGLIIIWFSSLKIPDFSAFEERRVINSTKIYDRTGEILLYDINKDIKRTSIAFENMGINIKNATVAVEDSEFYNHNGIRISSIIRATIVAKLTGKSVTGGSTITQQLIKNTLLTSQRSIGRKIKEWVLAIKIDKAMPKEKILELYLNEVPYGGTVYGIEEASKTYFGKNAADLSLAEAAYLASIPKSPTTLSPYGQNKDKLDERKNFVLFRMRELNFITNEEYEEAKNEVVAFLPQQLQGIRAPHFVFFIKQYLEEKYGIEIVERGGLKVVTTLNYGLQEKAEQIVKEGALENKKNWDGENASLVALDPKTGQILTMVGSRDYFDKEIDGNFNVVTAYRQPGSSFKPFIYATAFNKGFTPETVVFDLPTEFQTTCDAKGVALPGRNQKECYMPSNYDDKHRGPISLRSALAQSINIPAVKLFYLAGLTDSLRTAENMGISTLIDIARYGLTLVIGGGEVKPLDMASAYGVFANSGIRNPYTGILKIEDLSGKVLEEYTPKTKEVLSKQVALTISDILSDNVARTPTFGANSILKIPNREVAVKTGTTNNNKDAWTIGYTPSIVTAVWAGNNNNQPMKKGGSAVAGPIWNKFMNEALKELPDEKFEKPNNSIDLNKKPVLRGYWQGNDNFFIDKISNKLATVNTPEETKEEKVITNVHTILYWVDKKDVLGPPPENPAGDSQFNHWEIPVQEWWTQNSWKYPEITLGDKPQEEDNIHTEYTKPIITVLEPSSSKTYKENEKIQLQINSGGVYPLQKIDVFINDVYLGTLKTPFNFSFIPEELENLRISNTLRIIAYDTFYNRNESVTSFTVER
jgi:1A family penicillin-binding protein